MRKKIKKLMEGAISPDGQNDRLLQEVASKILELRSNEHAVQFPICIGTGSAGTWEFV